MNKLLTPEICLGNDLKFNFSLLQPVSFSVEFKTLIIDQHHLA